MSEFILEMQGIVKEFPGVKALDNVAFSVKRGEVHALVGENGAGKSTLMKVLSGFYPWGTYQGHVLIDGCEKQFCNIRDSEQSGVAIIYQELALIKQLSVAENICLGHEISRYGVVDWEQTYIKAKQALAMVGLSVNPATLLVHLGVGEQQLVEIAKALAKNARILILDEPTAALAESESANLLKILKGLREKGVTCIYVSHRLKEVFDIADRITILRDGRTVATHAKQDLSEDKLISLMVGRDLTNIYPWKKREPGADLLEIKNWNACDAAINKTIANVSFTLRRNEILGIAGLVGAGRTELVMSIFHAWGRIASGQIFLNGLELKINNASDAIAAGLSLASEDRKRFGLLLNQDVKNNISLASLSNISRWSVVNGNEEVRVAEKYTHDLRIKTPSLEQKAGNLSGGNQQKVVLGKWLMTKPKVLILDEPTRGIDVGAKMEIYNIINELVDQGVGVILISSELPEVLGMSDRILVMHGGRFTGELKREEATQEKVMYYATGGK